MLAGVNALRQEIDQLEKAGTEAKKALAEAKRNLEIAKQQFTKHSVQLTELQYRNKALKEEVQRLEFQKEKLNQNHRILNGALTKYRQQIEEKRNVIKFKNLELEREVQECTKKARTVNDELFQKLQYYRSQNIEKLIAETKTRIAKAKKKLAQHHQSEKQNSNDDEQAVQQQTPPEENHNEQQQQQQQRRESQLVKLKALREKKQQLENDIIATEQKLEEAKKKKQQKMTKDESIKSTTTTTTTGAATAPAPVVAPKKQQQEQQQSSLLKELMARLDQEYDAKLRELEEQEAEAQKLDMEAFAIEAVWENENAVLEQNELSLREQICVGCGGPLFSLLLEGEEIMMEEAGEEGMAMMVEGLDGEAAAMAVVEGVWYRDEDGRDVSMMAAEEEEEGEYGHGGGTEVGEGGQ